MFTVIGYYPDNNQTGAFGILGLDVDHVVDKLKGKAAYDKYDETPESGFLVVGIIDGEYFVEGPNKVFEVEV
jgi:hypothetical protein